MHSLQATLSHDPDQPNEDYLGQADGVLVLLDGAGIPKDWPTGCEHSVAWYVRRLGPALLAAAMDHEQTLTQALSQAIAQTADVHRDSCNLGHQNSPSATVAVVRVDQDVVQALVLADSTVLVIAPGAQGQGLGEVTALTDPALEQVRLRLAQQGRSADLPALRNATNGFWVAQDDPAEADHALTFSWPRDQVSVIAVLSDGAARGVEEFGDRSWEELAIQLAHGDLDEVLARVRALELSDPEGLRWPRAKCHDDATIGVLLEVNRRNP